MLSFFFSSTTSSELSAGCSDSRIIDGHVLLHIDVVLVVSISLERATPMMICREKENNFHTVDDFSFGEEHVLHSALCRLNPMSI